MRIEGCGRLRWNTTVCAPGVSIDSTFAYQSLRGLMRSLAGASGPSRTMSNVNFTSFDVKGWPSCHFTPLRRKKTRPTATNDMVARMRDMRFLLDEVNGG